MHDVVSAVMFPGQGSQSRGMGRPWVDGPAWAVVERAERVLDRPLAPLLLDAPLDHTADTQLAVVLVSLMAWDAHEGDAPVAFAGHSLGQLTALMAAGALTFEDGIQLVAHRAAVTDAAARRRPGGMAALLGADESQVQQALAAAAGRCWLANDNAPGHVVLAGPPDVLTAACDAARGAGVRRVVPLRVDGAFHTPLMASARDALAAYLEEVTFSMPSAPVVSNADARPYADAEGWRTRLADHVVQPVRWRDSLRTLAALGATDFTEVGPGSTLTALVKRTLVSR